MIGVLVLSAVLIVNLDAIQELFRDHLEIVALVPEAPAVRIGSPVLLEGVPVGRVTRIGFQKAGDSAAIALRLRLEGRAGAVLRADSRARATRQRFVGQPVVALTAGHDSAAVLRDGDTLAAHDLPSLDTILARGRALSAGVHSVLADTGAVHALVSARVPELQRLGAALSALDREAGALSGGLRSGAMKRAWGEGEVLDRLHAVRRDLEAVDTALAAAAARFDPGRSGGLREPLLDLGRQATELGVSVDSLQDRLRSGTGIVARIQRDSALLHAVQRLRAQVDSMVANASGLAVRMFLP